MRSPARSRGFTLAALLCALWLGGLPHAAPAQAATAARPAPVAAAQPSLPASSRAGAPAVVPGAIDRSPATPTSSSAPTYSPPPFSPQPTVAAATEPSFEPGQVLVLWAGEEVATSGMAAVLERHQLRPRQRYNLASLGFAIGMYVLPGEREAAALRDLIRAEHQDWIVDLNARAGPLQAANPGEATARLYARGMLGAPALAGLQQPDTPQLRLGVVDTGVTDELTRPEAMNGSTIRARSVLGPADKAAGTEHGNAVLQLMVGAQRPNGFSGVGPPVQLAWASVMREVNGKPVTNSLALTLALDWLLDQGSRLVNMSLGGRGDAILKAVVDRVLSKNVLIVAAAGNNPDNAAPSVYPAGYDGVWAVTAVDSAGKLYSEASRTRHTLFAAPGAELWVPTPAGGEYVSGTSYATALASATLAWQPPTFWALTASQRRDRVCAAARKLDDSPWVGCGLVQKDAIANLTISRGTP